MVSMISSGSLAMTTRGGRTRLGRAGSGDASFGAGALKRVSTSSSPESGGSVNATTGKGCGGGTLTAAAVFTGVGIEIAVGVETIGMSSKSDAVAT